MALQGRNGKLGMEKPTLESPDIIVEDERPSKEGNEERPTSYVFVKTFSNPDGSRYYHFTSVTVSKEGKEVVISNQEKSANRISRLLQTGKVAWINSKFSSHPKSRVEESVPVSETNRPTSTDNQSALLGINSPEPLEELKRQAGREGGHILILPSKEEAGGLSSRTSDLSLEGKDTNNSVNPQEKSKKSGVVIDDLSLYNVSMHKKKTPTNTGLNSPMNGLGSYSVDVSAYKVKDLIHSTQENDQKLLGISKDDTSFSFGNTFYFLMDY